MYIEIAKEILKRLRKTKVNSINLYDTFHFERNYAVNKSFQLQCLVPITG